jgi:hypothetical protein
MLLLVGQSYNIQAPEERHNLAPDVSPGLPANPDHAPMRRNRYVALTCFFGCPILTERSLRR